METAFALASMAYAENPAMSPTAECEYELMAGALEQGSHWVHILTECSNSHAYCIVQTLSTVIYPTEISQH